MPKRIKLFLQALCLSLIALMLVTLGRHIAVKQQLAPESTPTDIPDPAHFTAENFFDDSFKDLSEELQLAREAGQTGVFVFFDMQGCPYCQYMKDHVLNRVDVQDVYRKNFRNIIIDIHGQTEAADVNGTEMTEADLANLYGVNLTPTMIFFALNGDEIYRKQGFIKIPEDFLAMGLEIVEFSQVE
ncbi:MAG: thioredoxin fold domain-containing protein [Gammaproteobacteria bacterium]|nr:thioredoxin fold domain-containing protein [Gammaproteobacteria bacterium]NNC96800.1 thioredoxin fold domain-containing protein [Gammaproteobacteria bacterium]NNM14424.1 thioredoxin fold domain-containing protein [Gammaproteobacteria bacterium]